MTKPTLLVLSPGFPANEQDSTCLPALRMFLKEDHLQNHFNIRIVSMHYPFQSGEYIWFGLNVTALGGKNRKGFFRIPLYIKTWIALRNHFKKGGTTIVLSIFATEAALVASYFSYWHQLEHFCWIMGQDAKKENRYVPLLAKNTRFIAMSNFLKTTFETSFPRQVMGQVPSALYLPDLPKYNDAGRTFDFMSAGSLIPLKRFEWVLYTLAHLKKEGILASAVMLGGGPEKNKLMELAQSLGITDQVKFTGELPQNSVIEYMMKSRVFIHPSEYEGFGNVLIEALYAGCHVVSLFNPLTIPNEHMHQVKDYPDFYETAKKLMCSHLTHQSYSHFNTVLSAKAFIDLSQRLSNQQ